MKTEGTVFMNPVVSKEDCFAIKFDMQMKNREQNKTDKKYLNTFIFSRKGKTIFAFSIVSEFY